MKLCYVQGEVADSSAVLDALRAAYAMANPTIPPPDIQVNVKYINAEVVDTDG
jgi:hypothetical protein